MQGAKDLGPRLHGNELGVAPAAEQVPAATTSEALLARMEQLLAQLIAAEQAAAAKGERSPQATRNFAALKTVHATRGKYLRAEPVAALYAQGRVKQVAPAKAALEHQMCDYGPGGLASGASLRPARRAGLGGDRSRRGGAGGPAHHAALAFW
jgi:phage terminase large subunit-like protein